MDTSVGIITLVFIAIMWNANIEGAPGWGGVPDVGRMYLKLKYTYITQNTYIRS